MAKPIEKENTTEKEQITILQRLQEFREFLQTNHPDRTDYIELIDIHIRLREREKGQIAKAHQKEKQKQALIYTQILADLATLDTRISAKEFLNKFGDKYTNKDGEPLHIRGLSNYLTNLAKQRKVHQIVVNHRDCYYIINENVRKSFNKQKLETE